MEEKQQQAWFNQFAESAKKQEEQRKSQASYPWKTTLLPSTFHLTPEIAKELKKREQWKEVQNIAIGFNPMDGSLIDKQWRVDPLKIFAVNISCSGCSTG